MIDVLITIPLLELIQNNTICIAVSKQTNYEDIILEFRSKYKSI